MLLREMVGRVVVLRCRVETRGGDIFDAGERMRVRSTWRGMFMLEPVDASDGRSSVRKVPASWVREDR